MARITYTVLITLLRGRVDVSGFTDEDVNASILAFVGDLKVGYILMLGDPFTH